MIKILILNITRMGDIIQSSVLIKALKQKYENCVVEYALLDNFKDTAYLIPEIDKVIPLDFTNLLKKIDINNFDKAFLECEKIISSKFVKTYDILINLSFSKLSGIISYFINAKDKKGLIYTSENDFKAFDNWSRFFLSIVDYREYCPFNIVDIYLKIAGLKNFKIDLKNKKNKSFFKFGFVMGASTYDRRWSPEYFAKLSDIILTNLPNSKIFLYGTKSEKELGEKFFQNIKISGDIVNFIGKTNILELYEEIKKIDILVTNDTGTMHVGWFANTKIIELSLGPALYNTTGPYGEGHIVIQPDIECAPCSYNTKCVSLECHKFITPFDVFECIKFILNKNYKIKTDSKIKIFKSYFDSFKTVDYKLVAGHSTNDIYLKKIFKNIWLQTLENNLKNFEKCNIKINSRLNLLFSQIKIIENIITETLILFENNNLAQVNENVNLILNQEQEIRKIVFTEFKEIVPFYKYIEYTKNLFSPDDLELNLNKLKMLYKDFKFQLLYYINEFPGGENENLY